MKKNHVNEQVAFRLFGNLGFSVSEKLGQLCTSKLNKAIMAYIGLRCLEYERDLFILIVPSETKLHVGLLNTSYKDIEDARFKGNYKLEEDINLFYSNQKLMFVNEIDI